MHPEFPTTEWQVIAAACSPSIGQRRDALARVFESYKPSIEGWLRKLGTDPDRASEVAQDFFAKVLIERGLLDAADPGKGRLRTLLRAAVERYRVDMIRRDEARRRAENAAAGERSSTEATRDPTAAFDAEWTRTQLELAIRRARAMMLSTGREREWAVFEIAVLNPAVHGTLRLPMSQVAEQAGVPSAAIASNLLFQAKRRVGAMFKEVVSETVAGADDFRDELEHVENVLRRAREG